MKLNNTHLIADDNKILYCIWDNKIYDKDVWLGKVYYKNNIKLNIPYELTINDFKEISEEELHNYEVIENKLYDFRNMSYAAIKTLIIKLHYSNDDQIAIMLNNDEDKMREMQEWREFASLTAKKYSN